LWPLCCDEQIGHTGLNDCQIAETILLCAKPTFVKKLLNKDRDLQGERLPSALSFRAVVVIDCKLPENLVNRSWSENRRITMEVARRFVVRGRVQGVGYRYFALKAAADCGVAGTVRNLPDGSVEAVAEGAEEAVEGFGLELAQGPSYARVTSVDVTQLTPTGRYRGFNVVY